MGMKKILMVFAIGAILCSAFLQSAAAEDLYVVATKATQQASLNWIGFLKTNEVPLMLVTPQEFATHKKEKYVILMGGLDEPDGIKGLLEEALTKDDIAWLSQAGNGKMYVKSNIWDKGQRIIIFAGSDRTAEEAARKDSRDVWFDILGDWFELESPEGLHAY